MSTKMKLLDALLLIKAGEINSVVGICCNVDDLTDGTASFLMRNLMLSWPDRYTGGCDEENETFPVGGAKEYYEESSTDTFWQNPRRLALLDWMIEELQK